MVNYFTTKEEGMKNGGRKVSSINAVGKLESHMQKTGSEALLMMLSIFLQKSRVRAVTDLGPWPP